MKDLSLHVLDLLANSTVVDSTLIRLNVKDSLKENVYFFQIIDNGRGMSEELLAKVADPYTTTRKTRKVGLGLPLVKMNAEHCNGGFKIDRPPLGDIADAVVTTAAMNENIRFIYTHTTDKGQYVFDTEEVRQALDGMSINNVEIIQALKEMINSNLKDIEANE